ncbi:response regulator transcription factor [uncultured Piscinibacter sp.]|uniref:response regulator transcription factor n=1 Tax=uncultured Piscinibacter sp. TaxID=1131835 RepID=UPI0026296706|nr:response regulator transcription factor [uncultured Piscinibacter sp.]
MTRDVVLLVDDAPQSLGALCRELEAEGYTVLVAPDGESALQRLELVVPDAILLDALMPGMDGFETCRRIKAQPAWAHIPVIFMTGLAETEHIVAGFAAGSVDYVVKPVRAQEVLARLATHLRNARVARLAREAVDVGGLGVLVVDARSRPAWCSPQAQRWLAEFFATADDTPCIEWLMAGATQAGEIERAAPDGRLLAARRLGEVGLGETMWLLRVHEPGESAPSRLATAALTPRETEVLSWIAKGKTNRDVAEILGMSPRTVNKHLEHVFEKLGVETRAAAAALASRELG